MAGHPGTKRLRTQQPKLPTGNVGTRGFLFGECFDIGEKFGKCWNEMGIGASGGFCQQHDTGPAQIVGAVSFNLDNERETQHQQKYMLAIGFQWCLLQLVEKVSLNKETQSVLWHHVYVFNFYRCDRSSQLGLRDK